jgi:hypothetical protein
MFESGVQHVLKPIFEISSGMAIYHQLDLSRRTNNEFIRNDGKKVSIPLKFR